MNTLTVYMHIEPVGTLEQDASGLLRFTYMPAWLERHDAHPLARRTLQAIDTIQIPRPESTAVLSSIADSIKTRCSKLRV